MRARWWVEEGVLSRSAPCAHTHSTLWINPYYHFLYTDATSLTLQFSVVGIVFIALASSALLGSSSAVGHLLASLPGLWPYAPFCTLYFVYYFTRGFFITAIYTSLQVGVEAGTMTSEQAEDASKWMGSFGQIGSFLATMGIFVLIHAGVISDT